jgi:hypothetical protein
VILDWLYPQIKNPDLVGQVKLTADDIDPERAQAYQEKLDHARDYLKRRGLQQVPLYRTKSTEAT